MTYFIDRRLNPKGKSLANRQRFLRRARAQIREAVQKTLKDSGVADVAKDRKIRIAGRDLTPALRTALQTKYAAVNQEYHFTARAAAAQASDVWRVQFRRAPMGFSAVLDASTFAIGRMYAEPPAAGYERYRYEIVLLVNQKVA